jgi:iron complex outermembrane receptor protein
MECLYGLLTAVLTINFISPHNIIASDTETDSLNQGYSGSRSSAMVNAPASDEKKNANSLPPMTVTSKRFTAFTPCQTILEAKDFSGKYQDLQSVLETVSGITLRGLGGFGHYAEAAIRGSSPNQVQVFLDGVPLNDATGNAVDLSKIPLSTLQKISIIKSIPTIEYFGDNAGGVIDLSTSASGASEDGSVECGSFGYRAAHASIKKETGVFSHHFSFNYAYADNNYPYVNDHGTTLGPSASADDTLERMDNNFYSSFTMMYTNVFRPNEKNKLTSQVSAFITDEGIFYFPQANLNDGFIKQSKLAFIETYSTSIDSVSTITLKITGKTHEELFQRFRPFYVFNSPIRYNTCQPQACVDGVLRTKPWSNLVLTCNASGRYDGFDYDNLYMQPGQTQPHFYKLFMKIGGEANLRLNELLAVRTGLMYRYEIDSLNGQFSVNGFAPGGLSTHEGFPGGFGEIIIEPVSGLHIVTSASYSGRSPGFTEKFQLGANYAGNTSLRPETRFEYNAGCSVNNSFLALSASLFKSITKDKIIFTMNSQHMFIPQNMNEVDGWGVENELNLFPADWVTITNSITYMENIVRSKVNDWDGNDEPLLPRLSDYQEIKLRYKKVCAGHSVRITSPYFVGLSNVEKIVHDKPELSAFLGFYANRNFDIDYRLENYLDVKDFDFPQRPLPGIRHYLVFKFHFQ